VCIVHKYKSPQQDTSGNNYTSITYRDRKRFDEETFLRELQEASWSVLDTFDEPDDAVDYWNRTFLSIADMHAPLVSKRMKRQSEPSWITPELYAAIKERDRFLDKVRRVIEYSSARNRYKVARNDVF